MEFLPMRIVLVRQKKCVSVSVVDEEHNRSENLRDAEAQKKR